jgi:hypothetical protein
MKSLFAKLVVIFIIVGLTYSYGKAEAEDWKEFAEATTGIFQYDAASKGLTPEGYVRVWMYNVTKRESNLVEFNCKEKTYHVLDVIQYDEARQIKNRETYYDNPTHNWYDISPKSVPEALYEIACP